MFGMTGLVIIGVIFYVIIKYGTEEDFGYSFLRNEEEEQEDVGRPHPLQDKFSGGLSDEELIELARNRMENGHISEEEFEEFKEGVREE